MKCSSVPVFPRRKHTSPFASLIVEALAARARVTGYNVVHDDLLPGST